MIALAMLSLHFFAIAVMKVSDLASETPNASYLLCPCLGTAFFKSEWIHYQHIEVTVTCQFYFQCLHQYIYNNSIYVSFNY